MTQTAGFKFIPTNLAGVQLGGDVRLKQGLPDAPRLGVGGEEGGDTAGAPRCPKQRSHSRSTVPYTVLKILLVKVNTVDPKTYHLGVLLRT